MKRFISRFILALMGTFLVPGVAFAQQQIINNRNGWTQVTIPAFVNPGSTGTSGGAGENGVVAAKLLTGYSVGAASLGGTGSVSLTRTGTTGQAVAPPPYVSRLQFGVYDASSNSVVTCTGGTIAGINAYGEYVSETVTGTIDDSWDTSPVLTVNAYSDVVKVTFTGCVITSGTVTGDYLQVQATGWIYTGQPIKTVKQLHKVCTQDYDSSITSAWQCYDGYQINTEKTWSSVFHPRSSTIDVVTIFSSDTNLFSGADDSVLIEAFPFAVSY